MRIAALDHRVVRWPIEPRGAARGRHERAAVILAVRDETGATGLGEAAPLPGMSRDTLDDALEACDVLARVLPFVLAPRHASTIAMRATGAPAARFAIETALLSALAQRRRTSIAALLCDAPMRELAYAVVVDEEAEARAAIARGIRCLKLKVDTDLARVRRIAAAAPEARLRLDVNRGWPRGDVPKILAELAHLPIDYVEEPCLDAYTLLDDALPCKLALDESLATLDRAALERALRSGQLAALVLKPTVLGGFARCLELAELARAHGVAPVTSHALEGPIGRAACIELARMIGGDVAVGLGP